MTRLARRSPSSRVTPNRRSFRDGKIAAARRTELPVRAVLQLGCVPEPGLRAVPGTGRHPTDATSFPDRSQESRASAMPVAQSLISAQLRKSPFWARRAEAMARSGKLRCFLISLPVKIRWSRALLAWRILVRSTGLSAGLAGSPTGPLENSQTGRAPSAPAERSASSRGGFYPLAHVDRAAQHHRVELLDHAHLFRREHPNLAAALG